MALTEQQRKGLEQMVEAQESIADTKKVARILFYGDPGMQKTSLAALVAAELGNRSAILTTDPNWVVIKKFPDVAERIDRYPFTGMSQIKAIVEAHDEGMEPFAGYDTLIFDTYSTMVDMYIRHAVKTKKFNDQRDKDVASWTHYGLVANEVKNNIFDPLKTSNMNAIFLTHVKDPGEKDLKSKRFYIRSNLPDASWQPAAQEVSAIGWLHREEKGSKALVQFEPTIQVFAKSQIPTIEQKTYLADEIPGLIQKWVRS